MSIEHNLIQIELSEKSGVGLHFVRELEQGKAKSCLNTKWQKIKI